MEEYIVNPYEEEDFYADDASDFGYAPKKRRKSNPRKDVTPVAFLMIAGYVAWCSVSKANTGRWTWTPWKPSVVVTPISSRLQAFVTPDPEIARQRNLDRYIEESMASNPTMISGAELETISRKEAREAGISAKSYEPIQCIMP